LCTDSLQWNQRHQGLGWKRIGKEAVMRRILIVDDDLHVGLAICAWLAQHGFRLRSRTAAPTVSPLSTLRIST
jgi:PleD family two-component response regulator